MAKEQIDGQFSQAEPSPYSLPPSDTSFPSKHAITARPCILVVGPNPAQVGGVTTFIRILLSSHLVTDRYKLVRLDTTRAAEDMSSAGKFSLRNISYLLSQTYRLMLIAARTHPVVMHLAVTSGWSFWKGAVFLLVGRAFQMKSVAHIHGGSMREYYRKHPRIFRRLIGWVLKRADVVIALSAKWRRFLLDEVRSDLCVEVIPNTVDTPFSAATEQDDYACRQSNKIVLFVGQLARSKGVFDILRAIPLVLESEDGTVFLFAGCAHDAETLKDIQHYCENFNLENSVQFLGEVIGPEKLALFRRASLFILPSYGEGLPYALLEAMAVGLPVITTPVGAIPEIIEDGHHGFLIQPGDHMALAGRIIQLLEDDFLRQQMGSVNRQLIRERFLPDVAMAQLVGIYDRLQMIGNT